MKEATTIYASILYIKCPYCSEQQQDWYGNPCGAVEECNNCGKEYKITEYPAIYLD